MVYLKHVITDRYWPWLTGLAWGILFSSTCLPGQEAKLDSMVWDQGQLEIKLTPEQNKAVQRLADPSERNQLLHVRLQTAPDIDILGTSRYLESQNKFRFQPRFPLDPETHLNIQLGRDSSPLAKGSFMIPAKLSATPPQVTQVTPTASQLPANLLKFYLHFSTPMTQGNVYRYLKIIDVETGKPVELPFLELEQELWSPDGQRLTLFFDPGRIKRGLKPREEMGPIFEPGKHYEFRISGKWTSRQGLPLGEDVVKRFQVGAEDHQTPDPRKWKLTIPPAGSRQPLTVQFDESLDAALAERVLHVRRDQQDIPLHKIVLSHREKQIQLIPARDWAAGEFSLEIGSELEDLCGNRIGKPFDVDLGNQPNSPEPASFSVDFTIDGSGR